MSEGRTRGERGGKKVQKQKELQERVRSGEVVPKVPWPTPAVVAPKAQEPVSPDPISRPRSRSRSPEPVLGVSVSGQSVEKTLSQKIVPQFALRPREQPAFVEPNPRSVLFPPQAIYEVRISVDFNGVSNIARVGDKEQDSLHPYTVQLFKSYLSQFGLAGHRVGITSYIGTKGPHSESRRNSLTQAVQDYNNSCDHPAHKIGLRILSSRDKSTFLKAAGVDVHIDDRQDTCLLALEQGIRVVRVSDHRSNKFPCVLSLQEALPIATQGLSARLRAEPFESFFTILGSASSASQH